MNQKFKTVLIDTVDVFEREIEKVIEYRYSGLVQWAIVRYEDDTNNYAIPLWALRIKRRVVND